jgi:hypothetical protein
MQRTMVAVKIANLKRGDKMVRHRCRTITPSNNPTPPRRAIAQWGASAGTRRSLAALSIRVRCSANDMTVERVAWRGRNVFISGAGRVAHSDRAVETASCDDLKCIGCSI